VVVMRLVYHEFIGQHAYSTEVEGLL